MSKLVQVNVFGRLLNPTLIYFLETSTNYTKTLDTNYFSINHVDAKVVLKNTKYQIIYAR